MVFVKQHYQHVVRELDSNAHLPYTRWSRREDGKVLYHPPRNQNWRPEATNMSEMTLDESCELHKGKIESIIDAFSSLAPEIKGIGCTIKVAGQDERLGDLNGRMIAPYSDGLTFTILIAERQFKDSQYVHTLIHELVHLIDYSQFVKAHGNPNAMNPREKEEAHSWEFHLWAEYHAKQVGFWFFGIYRWYECGNETPPDGRYSFEEVDWQAKSVEEPLSRLLASRFSPEANKHLWDTILALVNYYARLSIAEGVNEDSIPDPAFPRDKLVAAFGSPALELFPLLRRMRCYDEAIPLLPSLSALFDKIIARLNAESQWSALRSIQFDQLSDVQEQMRKIVESFAQVAPMAEAIKSIAKSMPMADAIKSWTASIRSLEELLGNRKTK